MRQLQRRLEFLKATTRASHDIVGGEQYRDLAFQPLKHGSINCPVERDRVGNGGARLQQALQRQRLAM